MGAATAGGSGSQDLPIDLQQELDALEARADLSHYQLLGVPADGDGGAVRRAFLERSKRFHPDAWYRKELGAYAAKLGRAFQRISHAYQVLADDEARAEYDRENLRRFSDADRARVAARGQTLADEQRRARERRERLLRTKGFARIGAARQLYEQALAHVAEGNRGAAVAELKAARDLDPMRKEIAQKLVEVEKEAARVRVASAVAAAQEREAGGELQRALGLYTTALQQEPGNAEAAKGAVRCALELREWQQAATWGQRAAEAAPGDLEARLLAARAFAQVKLKARAKAELQQVLKLRPDHPEAKALLKGL